MAKRREKHPHKSKHLRNWFFYIVENEYNNIYSNGMNENRTVDIKKITSVKRNTHFSCH